MIKLTTILTLFILVSSVVAQDNLKLEWVKLFDLPGSIADEPVDMEIDNEGNVYAVASIGAPSHGFRIMLIKYNSYGEEEWMRIYEGKDSVDTQAIGLELDGGGNVYVAGHVFNRDSISSYDVNYLLLSYCTNGNLNWVVEHDRSRLDVPRDIALDNEGHILITGASFFDRGREFLTVKYSPNGELEWVNTFVLDEAKDNLALKVSIDNNGAVFVTGYSSEPGLLMPILKYSTDGDLEWIRAKENNQGLLLDVDSMGNVYAGNQYISKFDSEGNEQFTTTYQGDWDESYFIDLIVDEFQSVYIAGEVEYEDDYSRFTVLKYDNEGELSWQYIIGANGAEYGRAYSLTKDTMGNIYAAGSISGKSRDMIILKFDHEGTVKLQKKYDSELGYDDTAKKILVDKNNNLYVWGISYIDEIYNYRCTLLKFSQELSTKVLDDPPQMLKHPYLYQNYPNPFNPSSQITFSIPEQSKVELKVYDVLGQQVAELINENLSPDRYDVEFDGTDLSSGLYIYKITAGKFTASKKMVLIK